VNDDGRDASSGWAPLRGVRAAFAFLTRVPVGGFPYAAADWRWSSAHFPLVGAAIGALLAALWFVLAPLGASPAAALVLAASLLVTGGFHEDGLADTADALGGGYDRAKVLEILKDSRIGAFGALAVGASLLVRYALLAALGPLAPAALVASQCASRTPAIWLLVAMPYVTDEARSRSKPVTRAGVAQGAVATLWTAAILGGSVVAGRLGVVAAAAGAAAAAAAGLICAWRFHRRVGGVTGDFLGATQQVAEAAVLIAILAAR